MALKRSLSKLLCKGQSQMVRRQVSYQRHRNGVLGILDFGSHQLAERLADLDRSLSKDTVWGQKIRDIFPRLEFNPKTEGRRRTRDEAPFARECREALHNLLGSSDLSRSRKELYQELVVGSASDPLVELLGWSMEEIRSQ